MSAKHFTTEDFDSSIAEGLALVDFWASWCGPCKMIAPIIEELAQDYEGRVTVGKVDVDQAQELAVRFGVMTIPTLIYFLNGVEIDRKVGVMPKEAYAQPLEANL